MTALQSLLYLENPVELAWQTRSVKGQTVSVSSIAGHVVTTVHLVRKVDVAAFNKTLFRCQVSFKSCRGLEGSVECGEHGFGSWCAPTVRSPELFDGGAW